MKVSNKSYPHPVLGHEDDVMAGGFEVEFKCELTKDYAILKPVFRLDNSVIESLIKSGKASYVVEVECGSTFYRSSFSTSKPLEIIEIPSQRLRERVRVDFFVCANTDIKDYRPSGCHSDYGDATFEVGAGDVLAEGGEGSFIAEKEFDPLRPPISSFMSIKEGTLHEGPMEVNYDEEKITVVLSKSDWRRYVAVSRQKMAVGVLHASIVLPVLVDAIYKVQSEQDDLKDRNWFGRLDAILTEKVLKDKEPFEAAQKILEMPLGRNFQSIEKMLDVDQENHE